MDRALYVSAGVVRGTAPEEDPPGMGLGWAEFGDRSAHRTAQQQLSTLTAQATAQVQAATTAAAAQVVTWSAPAAATA